MKTQEISLEQIQCERDALLARVVEFFSEKHGVVGLLLAGSIPNGSDDAYSDIDLRVFTTPSSHKDIVDERLEIPSRWGDLLFNEWMEGTEVCVSHFQPFIKIDVFYWNIDNAKPSAWFNLPSTILFDCDDAVKKILDKSAAIGFEKPTSQEVSRTISKAIACAHESLRRSRRGELFYAQSLLDRVRVYIVQIEDWIVQFEPKDAAQLKIEKRISRRLHAALVKAYPPLNAREIEDSLITVCDLLYTQIVDLHNAFALDRILEKDLAAVLLVVNQQIIDSG